MEDKMSRKEKIEAIKEEKAKKMAEVRTDSISSEDILILQNADKDVLNAKLQMDVAQSKLELLKQKLIMKYNIGPNDSVDLTTRQVVRAQVQQVEVSAD